MSVVPAQDERVFFTRIAPPPIDTSRPPPVRAALPEAAVTFTRIGQPEVGSVYEAPVEPPPPPVVRSSVLNPPPNILPVYVAPESGVLPTAAPAPPTTARPDERIYFSRIASNVEDTSTPHIPSLPLPLPVEGVTFTRIGQPEVGSVYTPPVEPPPPVLPRSLVVDSIHAPPRMPFIPPPSEVGSQGVLHNEALEGLAPSVFFTRIPKTPEDISRPPPVRAALPEAAVTFTRIGQPEVGSVYEAPVEPPPPPSSIRYPAMPSTEYVRPVPFGVASPPSLGWGIPNSTPQNGVFPVVTYGGQTPLYAPYGEFSSVSESLTNITNQITDLSNELADLSLYVYTNPVSNWSTYVAISDVNLGGYGICNANFIQIDQQILTADPSQLFLNGVAIATISDITNIEDWAFYPALADVNMKGFNIVSISAGGPFDPSESLDMTIETKSLVISNTDGTSNFSTLTVINGLLNQNNIASSACNVIGSSTTIGGGSEYLEVFGASRGAGSNALYVHGGTTLDGGTIHGTSIGSLPVAGLNTQRVDVLPVGILLTTPTFITMNGLGAANIAMGGAVAIAAGSYVTLEHAAGAGANGIFVQNAARNSSARMVFAFGGTIFNLNNLQTDTIQIASDIQFWNNRYDPSGGAVPIRPVTHGEAWIDVSSHNAYFATLNAASIPTPQIYTSNCVHIGNLPNLALGSSNGVTFQAVTIGDNPNMVGQQTYGVAIGALAGNSNQGQGSVGIGAKAGCSNQGVNSIGIGYLAGDISQGDYSVAIGSEAGQLNQAAGSTGGAFGGSVAIGYKAGSNSQEIHCVAIGDSAGRITQDLGGVAVGYGAGSNDQGYGAVALGMEAGNLNQNGLSVAIGFRAGLSNLGSNSIAIGSTAAYDGGSLPSTITLNATGGLLNPLTSDSLYISPVRNVDLSGFQFLARNASTGEVIQTLITAVSDATSNWSQFPATSDVQMCNFSIQNISSLQLNATAFGLGLSAGIGQGGFSIAVGANSGQTSQGQNSVAVGFTAGNTGQGADCVAVGGGAGSNAQGQFAVAVGELAGAATQGSEGCAVGFQAGQTTQGIGAVAIGANAGNYIQGGAAVAIGKNAGVSNQTTGAVAVGTGSGNNAQGIYACAIGFEAGASNQGASSVAIGGNTGEISQGNFAVAVGINAANTGQGQSAIAIGGYAGQTSQGAEAIAIGNAAGILSQGTSAVAIGNVAGNTSQGAYAVSIGHFAGEFGQGVRSVAIGNLAGENNQLEDSIAVGTSAGNLDQGIYAVAIGTTAGSSNQGGLSVAIGHNAGSNLQGVNCLAIGNAAGQLSQSAGAIAMGTFAGTSAQGSNAIGIGYEAGSSNQGVGSVAVGNTAGRTGQQNFAVAVGNLAGNTNQEYGSVAIGYAAGITGLGSNAIAIGNNASAGTATQGSNSILLNATGSNSPAVPSGACYILPMRPLQNSNAYQAHSAFYNDTTGEVSYSSNAFSLQVIATSGTTIQLTPSDRGKVIILTGVTTQDFSGAALGANDTNFYVNVKNGNPNNGGDITITGATGNLTIHETKPTQNGGNIYLVWNGSALVSY